MNAEQLASFLQKATQDKPSTNQPTPNNQPTQPTQPVNQPTQNKQNITQFLEKHQKILSPEDFEKLKMLAVQLQSKKITKQDFEKEFGIINARHQQRIKNQSNNIPVTQTRPQTTTQPQSLLEKHTQQLSPEMKQLIIMYSNTPKEKKQETLQKHPELIPILRKIAEQKNAQKMQATQTAQSTQPIQQPKPQSTQQPVQKQPIVQQKTQVIQQSIQKPTAMKPQNFQPPPQGFIQRQNVPGQKTLQQQQQIQQQMQQNKINQERVQQQQQQQQQLLQQQQPPTKKQKVAEPKKSGRPAKEEETDIDSLNDVTKIAGVNLEKEDSLWDEDEESTEKYYFQKQPDFLNKGPLTNKIQLKANQMKLTEISDEVYDCISLSVQERMYNIIDDLIKISNHRHVKHDFKSVTSRKEKMLFESMNVLKESVKMVESEDKTEKKKITKKSDKKDDEDEDYKTSSANMAAEMAIIGDFGTSKKRKMMFDSKTTSSSTSSTPNSDNDSMSSLTSNFQKKKKKSTIELNDILLHMEKEEKLKKSKLLHGVYLKRK
eukprot:gene7068-11231_t